jgi:PAS domain S-box-containing protein
MKVRSRLALATALALLALLLTFYLGGRAILVNTFYLVEREVLRGIPTLEKAVQGELLQLDALATNVPEAEVLAALRHGQTDVLAAHFPVSRMLRDNLNLVALVDTNGGMAAAVYRPLGGRSAGALPASFRAHVAPGTNLLDYASSPTGVRKGVVLIDEGPLLVVSQRLPADPGLPMAGAVVCGRHLQEEAVIQRLAAALPGLRVAAGIRRDLTLRPADGAAAGSSGDIVGTHVEIAPWQSGLAGYEALLPVKDIYNRHVFSLVLSLPRTFGALAETALAWLSLFVALVGMLFIAPLLVLQGRAVLNPLTRLSEEIRALGPGDRTLRRLRWTRRDEFGVVAEAVNGMLDAIEREHRRIEESEGRTRALLEATPDLLFLLDRAGGVLDIRVPPGAEGLLAVPAAEATGRPLREVRPMPSDVQERLLERLRAAFETGQLQSMEFHLQRPDGQDVWAESRIVRIDDTRAMAIERSMTDRYRAERGRRLLEVRIGQKQKMESLGLLASGIAHDFNNILAAILGHAEEAMTRLPGNHAAGQALASIRSAAIRASGLTRQLQAYAGQGAFEFKQVNLNHLLGDMTQLLRSSLSKKATLDLTLDPRLPWIEGDSSQLWQVAMNLLLNASEALDGKAGAISLSTRRLEAASTDLAEYLSVRPLPPGTYALLEVADTGHGMSPEVLARIFDPFFSTKSKGRGLGLSAVMGIVQSHGGGIAVRSAPGAGTAFRVMLPAASASPAGATTTTLLSVVPAAPAPADAVGRVVLLAEDENDLRKVTTLALRDAGYSVHTAENGRVAVELFTRHAAAIGVVLLDVEMPEMNGEEAFRAIRAIRQDVPVVVMTGYGDVTAQRRFHDLAPSGILGKPFTRATLLNVLAAAARSGSAPPA